MTAISKTDPNFNVAHRIDLPDVRFFDVKKYPHFLSGIQYDEQGYFRMPEAEAAKVSEDVWELCRNTAGGKIRFVTNSPYVAIRVSAPLGQIPPHISATGFVGFDLYRNGVFQGMFPPPQDMAGGYESVVHFLDDAPSQITIHFPLYGHVDALQIGIQEGALLENAPAFAHDKRVVFYGSSITQGACVSRPGLSYVNQLARKLDCPVLNLGFSGSARGEIAMAQYIAALKPDVFVMDYEHNAPTLEHLQKTHEPFYRAFRQLCPKTPVLLLSSPDLPFKRRSRTKRREVIRATFANGKKDGDHALYILDGETFYPKDFWDSCSVDTLHPNDIGHLFMAEAIYPVLKEILET